MMKKICPKKLPLYIHINTPRPMLIARRAIDINRAMIKNFIAFIVSSLSVF